MTISFFDGFDHYAPNDNSASGSEIVVTPKAVFDKPTADSYYFGTAVGCDGTTLAVGSKTATTPGTTYGHGTVIVYKKSKFSYDYEQTISMPSDERVNSSEFGYGVAVNGDYIAIGAKRSKTSGSSDQGIVFLFKRNGETYEVVQKITPYDISSSAYFGESISINGNRMVVGAWQHDVAANNAGKVYVYEWDNTNLRYDLISEIVPNDTTTNGYFGWGCSIFGDTVFVGSPGTTNVSGYASSGKVYIYKWDGSTYEEIQQIEGFSSAHFGRGISGYDNFLVIGAPGYNSNRGAFRVYTWNGEKYVHKPEANVISQNSSSQLGDAVVINGNELFVGTSISNSTDSKVFKYELPELNIQPLSFQIGDKFPKDGWISKTSSAEDWVVEKVKEDSPEYPGAIPGTYILTAESGNSNKEIVRPLPIIQNDVFTIGLQVLGKASRDTTIKAYTGGYLLSVRGSSYQDNIMIYVDRTNLRLYAALFESNSNIGTQELTTESVYDSWLSLELQINKTAGSEYIKLSIDGNDPIELFTDVDSTRKVNVINSLSVISLKPTGSEIGTNTKTTWKYDNLWISNGSTDFLGALRLGKPRVGTTASSDNVSSSTNLDYAIHSTGDEFAEILAPGKYSENISINRNAIGTMLTVISKKGEMSRNHKNTLFINEGGVEKVSTTFDSTGVLKSNSIAIMNADVGETNQIEVGIRVDETKDAIVAKTWLDYFIPGNPVTDLLAHSDATIIAPGSPPMMAVTLYSKMVEDGLLLDWGKYDSITIDIDIAEMPANAFFGLAIFTPDGFVVTKRDYVPGTPFTISDIGPIDRIKIVLVDMMAAESTSEAIIEFSVSNVTFNEKAVPEDHKVLTPLTAHSLGVSNADGTISSALFPTTMGGGYGAILMADGLSSYAAKLTVTGTSEIVYYPMIGDGTPVPAGAEIVKSELGNAWVTTGVHPDEQVWGGLNLQLKEIGQPIHSTVSAKLHNTPANFPMSLKQHFGLIVWSSEPFTITSGQAVTDIAGAAGQQNYQSMQTLIDANPTSLEVTFRDDPSMTCGAYTFVESTTQADHPIYVPKDSTESGSVTGNTDELILK